MITAKEARDLTSNWVQYELRELEPLIRQRAVKGLTELESTFEYPNKIVDLLIEALQKAGFKIVPDKRNFHTTITIKWD